MARDGWRATARPPSSTMLVGELASVSRRPNLGYPWVRVDVRNTTEVTSSPETSLTVSYHRSTSVLYFCFVGPHLSVCVFFDFVIFFHRFSYMFQKFISRARSVQFW